MLYFFFVCVCVCNFYLLGCARPSLQHMSCSSSLTPGPLRWVHGVLAPELFVFLSWPVSQRIHQNHLYQNTGVLVQPLSPGI